MRRRIVSYLGVFVGAALLASCGQDARRSGPTSPLAPQGRQSTVAPGTCTSFNNLVAMANAIFAGGGPNVNSVLGKLDNLNKKLQKGDLAGAQDQAQNIVSFVQSKAPAGTGAQVQAFVSAVLCYVGLTQDTFVILPSDQAQILKAGSGQAAISLQPNTVTVPTVITIAILPANVPPLNTKLDQYPGFIALTQSSPLTKPAIVAVCPSSTVPAQVLGRLRLGHQASTGFEITPAADGSFLDCSTVVGQSRTSGWLHKLASLVLPTPLYAKTFFGSGVAGLATEFSPFGPVDDELFLSSGASGTRTEFQKLPNVDSLGLRLSPKPPSASSTAPSRSLTPGGRSNTVVNGVCTAIDALVGMPVETECRPTVTIKTFQGTLMQNVPVGWAIGLGGGVIAPEVTAAHTCGAFGSIASTSTDANANASVCWTLGATPGTNTVVATPSAGGDAPLGVFFNGTFTFTATAKQITPTVGATGGTFPYDGLGHPGSGTCSNNLTPVLSYTGAAVPTNAGTYTLTVTCGAGNPIYVTVTTTATIQITPASTTASISCPASAGYIGVPVTPCQGAVTGLGLSQTLTPTYANNVLGLATATVSYGGSTNYLASTASTTFRVRYTQSECFGQPVVSAIPPTPSPQRKGSTIRIQCKLLTGQGLAVTNAAGDIVVQDRGTDGLGNPVTVLSLANAFSGSPAGIYMYSLDTSPSGFVAGHYYFVTATWSDGTMTTGWFYLDANQEGD